MLRSFEIPVCTRGGQGLQVRMLFGEYSHPTVLVRVPPDKCMDLDNAAKKLYVESDQTDSLEAFSLDSQLSESVKSSEES